MSYANLDNEEILQVAISAINQDNHAEAISLLKFLLERDSNHVFANYLLAAEHAQIGMMDRAEAGFVKTVALAPEFVMSRFQLGQLYLVKGDVAAAKSTLEPLTQNIGLSSELSFYAKGLIALADERMTDAIFELRSGLECVQEIPALAGDMKRILDNLSDLDSDNEAVRDHAIVSPPPSSVYLSGYAKSDN